ncbi:hypothetical protein COU77_00775 [Candidatus Peregrinibacteria bacterium CG10_big_fil_rev_8_21_14_0_10_49_16]|nr:MAG: hypothetical protein COW95_03035 [Candidatus Peregrinibacteria bacterium CG22_combo_CG10-13_8_21_14_all_49_11]PIR52360.1 MAG: hypothetical protein COU77_00775 [Candidatus Peregrinibacteria bacterium CG10_big_fil_rev_8_21_14_0_10_49_16]
MFSGATALLEEDVFWLQEGEVLVRSTGVSSMNAGTLRLFALDGISGVLVQEDAVTIMAFSTPVFVEKESKFLMLVPAGQQWKYTGEVGDVFSFVEALDLLPPVFLRERLQKAQSFPVFSQEDLLTEMVRVPEERVAALDALQTTPVMWLLAANHPRSVGPLWIAEPPVNYPKQFEVIQTVLLPFTDRVYRAVPTELVVQEWGKHLPSALTFFGEREEVFPRYVQLVKPLLMQFAEEGYIERMEWYMRVLEKFAVAYSSEVQAHLEQLRHVPLAATLLKEHKEEEIVPSQQEELPGWDAVMLETMMRDLIRQSGGMFLTSTELETHPPYEVEVRSLVLSSPTKDRIVSFTYNVARNIVFDVFREGTTYPLPVTWEQFVMWMKK